MAVLGWVAWCLRSAGLSVVEYQDWTNKGVSGAYAPKAVMWHHDASAAGPSSGMPNMIANVGNSTTPPPLAPLWVDTGGTWWVLAGGRCNHAGSGDGWGVIAAGQGNRDAVGVETDHTIGEAWPPAQLQSLRVGTAAILAYLGVDPAKALCGHKEYTYRKPDPDGLDMNHERAEVARIMKGEPTVTCAFNTGPGGDRSLMQSANARVTTLLTMDPESDTAEEGDPGGSVPNKLAEFLQAMDAKLNDALTKLDALQNAEAANAEAVADASKAGTLEALAEGTVKVDITVAGNPTR